MSHLYMFLKRNSPLFNVNYARACHIKEHYAKFLTNRYGVVKHYYMPQTDMAMIEGDIRLLIEEEYRERKYKELLDPPDNFA